jgi:SNF2 family DNA or RNA helicase
VVDESFFLKNPSATRTQLALRMRSKCYRGLVLCGTPAPNSYEDVIAQCNIADNGYAFSGYVDQGRESVATRLRERAVVIRRQKSAIMPDLAEKRIQPVLVNMGDRQRRLYQEAKNNLVLHLRTLDNRAVIKATDGYFEKLHALMQLCSWPASIDPTFNEVPAKVLALDGLLSDLIGTQGKKVVLWSAYVQPILLLAARYKQYSPVVVSGETASEDRSSAVSRFQSDPETKLFIGNPSAAGAGITLTAASDAVFFSFSNRAADFLQAVDRIHRRGQDALEVVIHILLCDSSIERYQLDRLLAKERSQGELLRDKELGTRVEDAIAALLADG